MSLIGNAVSPDGKWVAATGPDLKVALYPTEPGEPRLISGIAPDELPVRWSADGRSLYVLRRSEAPARVYLVDLETGRRTLWRELSPPDPAGVIQIGPIVITPDGKSYVYSYRRILDDLYLVKGLR